MKRTFAIVLGSLAAAALFGGLAYAVLVALSVGWLWLAPPVVSVPTPGDLEPSWP